MRSEKEIRDKILALTKEGTDIPPKQRNTPVNRGYLSNINTIITTLCWVLEIPKEEFENFKIIF